MTVFIYDPVRYLEDIKRDLDRVFSDLVKLSMLGQALRCYNEESSRGHRLDLSPSLTWRFRIEQEHENGGGETCLFSIVNGVVIVPRQDAGI